MLTAIPGTRWFFLAYRYAVPVARMSIGMIPVMDSHAINHVKSRCAMSWLGAYLAKSSATPLPLDAKPVVLEKG